MPTLLVFLTITLFLFHVFSSLPLVLPLIFLTLALAQYTITHLYTSHLQKTTILTDIQYLTTPPPRGRKGTAIVVGGSIAGLITSAVLLNHFDRVVVLESEEIGQNGDGKEERKHVPHGRLAHVLLPLGLKVVKTLFPGLENDLLERGGIPTQLSAQYQHIYGGLIKQTPYVPDTAIILTSRPLLESTIRHQLLLSDRIEFRSGTVVTGLVVQEGDVRGVKVFDGENKAGVVEGVVVVDATGRSARGIKWLQSLSYPTPPTTSYDPHQQYTCARFKTHSDLPSLVFNVGFPGKRHETFAIFRVENNECILGSMSTGNPHPIAPRSDEAMRDWMLASDCPELNTTMFERVGERVSEWFSWKFPGSRWVRYEEVDLPGGFVAVGDAVCSFNPIYGQGMTAAAIAATTLDATLRKTTSLKSLPKTYHTLLAHRLEPIWDTNESNDIRFKAVTPSSPLDSHRVRLERSGRVFELLVYAAQEDAAASGCLLRLMSMVAGQAEMLEWRVLWAIAKVAWRRYWE
ncbi:uncharacterized protein SPPG_07969 [Spizellomyces punctatus DAOM BR117]|uniref:FAD-binding domain-containing protein n=1 Tax=Spizellomyces punctatus (strain DAOM BR117) TaxID=645134 RepID=A0A0L0H6C1_SPIPD|nr:uncharacterized protein SPPG_07969 [Spizellomyces punctatus DAOM BR117]KNC96762.1 hypothetical protein SPPG_07969 [Spizellomyces punctatus DAOM BR117]|eukprot:XP_016604802.1 hypothetical protein SPPG_07969 [Spizellomyces punctatus DAOM BR117]